MLRNTILVILIFFAFSSKAQMRIVIMFDHKEPITKEPIKILKDGKIEVNDFRYLKKHETPTYDSRELDKWNSSKIEEARKSIKEHLENTYDALGNTNNNDIIFYKSLWGDQSFQDIRSDMKLIIDKMKNSETDNKYAVSASGIVFYRELDTLIAALYAGKHYKVDTSRTPFKYSFSVKRWDPYNDFLARYYNMIMSKPGNGAVAKNKTIRDMNEMLEAASKTADTCRDFVELTSRDVNLTILKNMYSFAQTSHKTILEEYMQAPWFKQWLWFTGGKINTMPLGFTGDKQLRIMPDINSDNAKRFETFVEKTDTIFIETDSLIDVMVYKKMVLDHYKKGEALFTDSANYREKIEDNKKKREEFLDYKEYISNISMPYADNGTLSKQLFYSPADANSSGKIEKVDPITFDDEVTVTVHNIKDKGSATLVLKSSVDIKDEPAVIVEVGNATSTLKDALANLSGISGVLTNILGELNRKPDPKLVVRQRSPGNNTSNDWKPGLATRDRILDSAGRHNFISKGRLLNKQEKEDIINQIKELHESLLTTYASHFPAIAAVLQKKQFDEEHVKAFLSACRVDNAQDGLARATEDYEYFFLHGAIARSVFDYSKPLIIARERNLSNSIKKMLLQSPPITEKLEAKDKKDPAFHSEILTAENVEKARNVKYEVITLSDTKKDTTKLGILTFKTGKRHFIQASAGLTYSFSPIMVNKVDADKGVVTVTSVQEQYGVAAMLHFYPLSGGVFLQDKSFCGHNWTNIKGRMNITAGIDFRKVPDNVYLGIGYDFGPGIRLSTGFHFYKYTQYEVRNNQIADQGVIYKTSFPFVYLGIDPLALVNTLNIFSKNK